MFIKTIRGYSLAETLISLALLSLLVIVYSNISTFQHSETTRDNLIKKLFVEAHSIALIAEDKNIESVVSSLYSYTNPIQLSFLANSNHTRTMSMSEFATTFSIILPNDLLNNKHDIVCILSPILFGEIQFTQMTLYVLTNFEKRTLYGFASFIF